MYALDCTVYIYLDLTAFMHDFRGVRRGYKLPAVVVLLDIFGEQRASSGVEDRRDDSVIEVRTLAWSL